jgi:hypothetical protein
VGTSHMSDNQHISAAMQQMMQLCSNVLLGYHGNEINNPLHSNGHVLIVAYVGGSHKINNKRTPVLTSSILAKNTFILTQ